MRMLNLGIVAHVDAGKTSLTERLLFESGAIRHLGSVDDGSTTTDGMELERRRGITIRSAVAAFTTADCRVHLIDTPGHTDFVAEVERALGVLDGAILVISAVEGVQAHTRVLMRTLRAMRVPTLLFVNKIDRVGARHTELLADIRRLLSETAIPLNRPVNLGSRTADVVDIALDAELLAEHSDTVLQSYVDGHVDGHLLQEELRAQSHAGILNPLFFGSAITGAGISALRKGIAELLPSADPVPYGPLDGVVFAVEHGRQRFAVARLFSGSLAARDEVVFGSGAGVATTVLDASGDRARVLAGGIARIGGLPLRIGDRLGAATTSRGPARFSPPTLETIVTADNPTALFTALSRLADEDPLINVRRGQNHGSLVVSLYGDVQREVIAARLAEEFGVEASFSAPRVVCVERVAGIGHAVQSIGDTSPVMHWATIGLRVEPGSSGVVFRLEVERGSLPAAFMTAIEETVHEELREGIHGWQVVDCVVTLTHSGFSSPISVAADFRGLTPLVLADALAEAGTTVCEPLDDIELEVPEEALSTVLNALIRHDGLPETPLVRNGSALVDAVIPSARLREFHRALPGLSGGSGVLTSRFGGYRPVNGEPPTR
ncbi:TetM/TetW/TetO/TetS family tetracycline resistance ribosomal protection protein [Allokutzneria sp. A3M-2-11 16]|uniref:elongation factor G n=1 Tax=Allokutzneria sp. A3M-2-11 16 TaxID=2962043 RepID=UPI0020B6EC0F|nr:TetM/TetW/TetO/TetS family tetracycline resistance ribosomal protection protein [Allokutzneria sp. A3M-2-11 16]MCP3802611.1 TetM/TetW/TetO/TetS family tetracycline resistance ribosomal protection protein [Allokutzneria sp. A3M-2-11 16]